MNKKTELLKYSLLIGLFIVMGLSVGCATRDGKNASTDAKLAQAGNARLDSTREEDDAKGQELAAVKEEDRIRIQSQDNATRLKLPIGRNVNLDSEYEDSLLTLNCAPAIHGPLSHDSLSGTILEDIDFSTIPGTNRIEKIRIKLERYTPYSLSRTDDQTMELTLATSDEKTQATSNRPSIRQLKDINFYETEENGLKIVLTGDEQLEYKMRPSENDELNLALPGTRIPSPQAKLYNLDNFDSPVQKALLSNSPVGGQVHLSLSQSIPVKIRQKGNELHLAVAAQQTQARETAEVEVEASNASASEKKEVTTASSRDNETITQFQNTLGDGLVIPGMQDEYTGKPVSIDVQNAEVSHVLRLLSDVGNFNLVMDQGVGGTITLKLKEVPWDQVLDNILRQKSLGMKKVGNKILRIAPIDKLRQEQQRNIQVRKSSKEAEESKKNLAPLYTEYIQINYSRAQNLQSQVEKFLSERGEVSHDPRTNQLIVSDTEQTLENVKSVVNKLDRAERQVLIEARIVYATDSFTENLGLRWGGGYTHQGNSGKSGGIYGTGTATTAAGAAPNGYAVNVMPDKGAATLGLGGFLSKVTGSDLYALDAQLQIGESDNQVQTISKPKVVTLNNQEAVVEQGTMLATKTESESGGTTTEYTEATLNLTVTPQITPDNKLIMDIQISDDSPTGEGENISTRSVETKLIVDNGNTIVIGGVQQRTQTENQERVPGVASLPIMGWLFKNKYSQDSKRELLVFIRPKIL